MTNYLMVKQFNQVFGHPAPDSAKITIFSESPDVVKLRNSLIHEEITELRDAINAEDVVEIIDALSDIQYVAYGLLVVYGVDGDNEFTNYMPKNIKCWIQICRANVLNFQILFKLKNLFQNC